MSAKNLIRCGQCNTLLTIPPQHGGYIRCGACQTNLQLASPSGPPSYNSVVNPTPTPQINQVTTTITTAGGCANCHMHQISHPRWTMTAWLLCLCFFPFNFCIPGCQPSEAQCRNCGHVVFVDM